MSEHILIAVATFLCCYFINILYISVFYHRGLAHGAVILHPHLQSFVVATGNWITGLDPLGWICMHRNHHAYSDTKNDPHSPQHYGILGVATAQLKSYQRTLVGLIRKEPAFTTIVSDLNFSVSVLNSKKYLWLLPYILHFGLGVAIGLLSHPAIGAAYFLGLMSHPIQGWAVNSLAHSYGYRNFRTSDYSTNNTIVSWLVMGEGYQNNHHRYPKSAKFSFKWWEVDSGWLVVNILQAIGLLQIVKLPYEEMTQKLSVNQNA